VVAVCLLWLTAMPVRAQDAEAPLTLDEYRAELAAALAAIEADESDLGEEVVAELRDHFATITAVALPNGEIVEVRSLFDTEATVQEAEISHPPKLLALAQVRGTLAQIDAAANDNTATRLALLADILARPEFNRPMSLWDRFWEWLETWIHELLPTAQGGGGSGFLAWLLRAIPWIVTTLVVAVVIVLLSYWLQRLLRAFVRDARSAKAVGDDDLPSTAAEARQQARVAAQSGLYRDAVRRLYLAALLQLAEHDLITYERSLTNREVLIRVPAASPIRPHLEPVIATFDQVWYGVREPDQATFHAYEQEIDQLAVVARRSAQSTVEGKR
jgi:hypothetical protein